MGFVRILSEKSDKCQEISKDLSHQSPAFEAPLSYNKRCFLLLYCCLKQAFWRIDIPIGLA